MTFTITSRRTATVVRLSVAGDIDMSTAGQLDGAIADALSTDIRSLLIDLGATTFCDCAGVTALLAGRRNAAARGVAYQVVNPTGISLTVLRLLNLYSLLTTRTP